MFFGKWFKEDSPYGVLLREEPSTLSNMLKIRRVFLKADTHIVGC